MREQKCVLIIDGDDKRRQQMETVLNFLGFDWRSGDEPDCLAYLDGADDLLCVVVGIIAVNYTKKNSQKNTPAD